MPIEHRQTLFDFSDDSSIYKEANRQTQVFLGGGIIPAVAKFGLGFVSALVARMCFSVTRWASGSGHSRLHTSEAYSPGHVPTLSWKLILACWCHLQRFASVSKLSAECQSMPRKSVKFTDNVYFYHYVQSLVARLGNNGLNIRPISSFSWPQPNPLISLRKDVHQWAEVDIDWSVGRGYNCCFAQ